MIDVEICCNSVASAVAAQRGGAKRIELCSQLECGGLTPSMEDVYYCVRELGLRTHVLIRPRAGDFCYDEEEMEEVRQAIVSCKAIGAAAIVVGFLTREGAVDEQRTAQAVRLAEGMEVTFHRAFDEVRQDPLQALQAVANAGCHRLLTSGCAPTAWEGREVIARLVAAQKVKILAGSGIVPANVAEIVRSTGVGEVHGSCKQVLNVGVTLTDEEQVRMFIQQVSSL